MKKLLSHAPSVAGGFLGLAFLTFGLNHFLHFMPAGGTPPAGSPAAMFFGAIFSTGFLTMVKVLEILGGILVAIPKTRNFGLLILGSILVNIVFVNILIIGHGAVFQPPVIVLSALALYLLWAGRQKFIGLLN